MRLRVPYLVLIFTLAGTNLSSAQSTNGGTYSDPCFPEKMAINTLGLLTPSVKTLEQREQMLIRELEQFPAIESRISPPYQHFGYLGGRHPLNAPMDAWIHLNFFGNWTSSVDGIALVPAYYPAFSVEENYGFPKRFKIDIFSHQEPHTPVTVVDWTEQDFPDPGLYPVFFSFPARNVKSVRLTVTKGAIEGDSQFFAMDELMVFQQGNNVAPPAYQGLTASDAYDKPPYWKLQFLTDRKIHTGNYFHTHSSIEDFLQYFDANTILFNKPEILIDLGEVHNLGRVELHPAQMPGSPIPEFGFPSKYQISVQKAAQTNPTNQSGIIDAATRSRMRWHSLSSVKGRFLRITLHELSLHNGRPVLALGEIRVIGRDGNEVKNFARGKTVTISQVPKNEQANTSLLVDGFSNGREIMPERDYIEQLAARKIIEQNLAQTQHSLIIARATRKSHLWTISISSGVFLFFSFAMWIVFQRIAKEHALLNLRQQIAADLHDDICSNLGTISMITKRLQQDASPLLIKDKLLEIGHIAQESFISVKEIIWHMDSDVVYLCEMFEKLEKTARSILTGCEVNCCFPSPQGIPVPAKTRRNIMLLLKEALYNCAKYAEAQHMHIHADVQGFTLILSLKDDGIGFAPFSPSVANSESGRGLSNMKRRARLLGAEFYIQSEPGKGTEVTLKMPLNGSHDE